MLEAVWQSAEVDALYRLSAAGVQVPQPHLCFEGVLLMDLVLDAQGNVAPRLNNVELSEAMALEYHAMLINQVVWMLCAGVLRGGSLLIQHSCRGRRTGYHRPAPSH